MDRKPLMLTVRIDEQMRVFEDCWEGTELGQFRNYEYKKHTQSGWPGPPARGAPLHYGSQTRDKHSRRAAVPIKP